VHVDEVVRHRRDSRSGFGKLPVVQESPAKSDSREIPPRARYCIRRRSQSRNRSIELHRCCIEHLRGSQRWTFYKFLRCFRRRKGHAGAEGFTKGNVSVSGERSQLSNTRICAGEEFRYQSRGRLSRPSRAMQVNVRNVGKISVGRRALSPSVSVVPGGERIR